MSRFFLLIYLFTFYQGSNSIKIFVAKNDWHVGIILHVNEKLISNISAIKQFESYKYVDIGWGDAEFYQSETEFDLYLAAKAVLLPTPSVIRIQGYNTDIEQIMNWRDYMFEIEISYSQFDTLCTFISNSFKRDSTNLLITTNERFNGHVKFFSSNHNYHIAYTCNTWLADGLEYSGLDVDASNVVTAENLLLELTNCGKLLKLEK